MAHTISLLHFSLASNSEFASGPGQKIPLSLFSLSLLRSPNIKITDFLKQHDSEIHSIQSDLNLAMGSYGNIYNLPQAEIQEKLKTLNAYLLETSNLFAFYFKEKTHILSALGDVRPMRYLILNQNRDEIRASGGFPGSVVTLEVYKGKISKYEAKDIYYYDWHLYPYHETPPEGLNKISPNYGLRDANYPLEFREAVEKINFFYEKGGGGSIDTALAINQGIIIDFLNQYGPIEVPKIPEKVTGDNFSLLMSLLVEAKYGKVGSPKDVLFSFVESLENTLIHKRDILGYLGIIRKNFMQGEILVASRDRQMQDWIDKFDFQEPWKRDTGNILYPVFTSISGNKSDRYMKRDFTLETKDMGNCTVRNSFSLTSTHRLDANTLESMRGILKKISILLPERQAELLKIQGNGMNRQFVRMVVPKGSTLTPNPLYDVKSSEESPDYSVFSFYHDTDANTKSSISFEYLSHPKNCQIPGKFYRQPGLENVSFVQK